MINVSTKTGDQGQTGLANGQRLSKADPRIEVIGNLDELNSWLGVVVAHWPKKEELKQEQQFLLKIQNQLFKIGAEIAQAPQVQAKQVQAKQRFLKEIEARSANLQKQMELDWHQKFLLPGGSKPATWLDLARSVCRRAERSLVNLQQQVENDQEKPRPLLLKIINRLSDYLYVLRCFVNLKLDQAEKEFNRDYKQKTKDN